MNQAWRTMRACHLRTYPECRACGTLEGVVVHHVRYRGKRGQSEQPGDLMTLCAACHDELHRWAGRTPAFESQMAFVLSVRVLS